MNNSFSNLEIPNEFPQESSKSEIPNKSSIREIPNELDSLIIKKPYSFLENKSQDEFQEIPTKNHLPLPNLEGELDEPTLLKGQYSKKKPHKHQDDSNEEEEKMKKIATKNNLPLPNLESELDESTLLKGQYSKKKPHKQQDDSNEEEEEKMKKIATKDNLPLPNLESELDESSKKKPHNQYDSNEEEKMKKQPMNKQENQEIPKEKDQSAVFKSKSYEQNNTDLGLEIEMQKDQSESYEEKNNEEKYESIFSKLKNKKDNFKLETYFKIEKELGAGSFGKVYEVKSKDENEAVFAVKEINIDSINLNDNDITKEKETLEKLKNEPKKPRAFIPFYGFFDEKGTNKKTFCFYFFFKSMPYSLKNVIAEWKNEKKSDLQKSYIYFKALSNVLAFLQCMGICHRDLKPANILLDKDKKKPYLIDFGISKLIVSNMDFTIKTKYTHTVAGTESYFAPEFEFLQEDEPDEIEKKDESKKKNEEEEVEVAAITVKDPFKCDVYSFGILMIEILTLKNPNRNRKDIKDLENKLNDCKDNLQFIFHGRKDYQEMKKNIIRCIAIDPAKRPSFIEIFFSELEIKNQYDLLKFRFHILLAEIKNNGKPQEIAKEIKRIKLFYESRSEDYKNFKEKKNEMKSQKADKNKNLNSFLKHGWVFNKMRNRIFSKKKRGSSGSIDGAKMPKYKNNLAVKNMRKNEQTQNKIAKEIKILEEIYHLSVKPNAFPDYHGYVEDMTLTEKRIYLYFDDYPQDLRELLQEKTPMKYELLVSYFISLVNALAFLQIMGYSHCDLKPENLMFDKKKQIKLIDFGSCIKVNEISENSVPFRGTLFYQSPEWLKINDEVENENETKIAKKGFDFLRSDIFVLGMIILEMGHCLEYKKGKRFSQCNDLMEEVKKGIEKFKETYKPKEEKKTQEKKNSNNGEEDEKKMEIQIETVEKNKNADNLQLKKKKVELMEKKNKENLKKKYEIERKKKEEKEKKERENARRKNFNYSLEYEKFIDILEECLFEMPSSRPDFVELRKKIFVSSKHHLSLVVKEQILLEEYKGPIYTDIEKEEKYQQEEKKNKEEEIIRNKEKLSLMIKKKSRVQHSAFLIFFSFLSILIFAASLGLKSNLFYQLKDKNEDYLENYNMVFNSFQAIIFGLDPLMIVCNIFSLVLIFFTRIKKKHIWKYFELVLFLFLCIRILVGIMFLAGNDSFCKRVLDSFDGENFLKMSEDIYYILKSVWIDEIISIILLFLISVYFICKIIRSYQDKNDGEYEYDWKFLCFTLVFCLIIILSLSLKFYLWSLLDNADFYLENFPTVFRSLHILLVIEPLMLFFLIIVLIFRVINNISFEIKSSDLILLIICTIFSAIKFILALFIAFGDNSYCQNTIKNLKNINDQGSYLNFLSANWNFVIFEITIYGILLLIANFTLFYFSYKKIDDDNLERIYTLDSINYILSIISLSLTFYFWGNSSIKELLLEKFATTFQSFIGIIIWNTILIVSWIVFTLLNFTEEEKLIKGISFVLFPFAITRIILSIIFLVGDYSSILELIIINSNNEISQNLLKINFQYEIFYLVFIILLIVVQIAKFLIEKEKQEILFYFIIFFKILLSLVFVAYFLSSIKDSDIFSEKYDVLFKSAQGILIVNVLILCFIVGIIATASYYDNYDFRDKKETIYGLSFIVLIVFYLIKLILAVTFLKGCNYEWEISNELLNSNDAIALSFEESLKILFIYQIIELFIYAFIFAVIIIVVHNAIFSKLFEYYRDEKTVFALAIFVNYALTIISLGISTAFWDKVMANDYLIETYPTTFRSFEGIIGMDVIIIFVFFIFYLLKINNKEDEDKILSVFVAILMILLTIRIILGIIFMVADDYFINDWIDSPNPEKYGSLDLQAKLKTQWQFEIFYLVSLLPIGIAILFSLSKII